MANTVWLITALTNLHVGDECSTGYGIIDKSVQRNPITTLPCINSSSLKGALNEYFSKNSNLPAEELSNRLIAIFGSDKTRTNNESQKGNAVFFDANLAALPIPENNGSLYCLISSAKIRAEINNMCTALGINNVNLPTEWSNDVVDKHVEIKDKCSDESLPIIARNKLDNGVSQNLWYEQIVPQQTVFYTFMNVDQSFEDALNGAIVQIGANATIGYGYCQFEKIG